MAIPLLNRRIPVTSTSHGQAADIMGPHFYGLRDALDRIGVGLSPDQRANLEEPVPFSPDTLARYRGNYILVPVLPVSIMDLRRFAPALFRDSPADDPWYKNQGFANEPLDVGWRLIRLEPMPGTRGRPRLKQMQSLGPSDGVPGAAALLFALVLHRLYGHELNRGYYRVSRTENTEPAWPLMVSVGNGMHGNPYCLHVYQDGDERHTGLASERRTP